jgi:hypothetical protein
MSRKGMACPLVWSTVPARCRPNAGQWKSQVPVAPEWPTSVTGRRPGADSRPTRKIIVPSP